MSTLTPLQKAIEVCNEKFKDGNVYYNEVAFRAWSTIKAELESLLPEERKALESAFDEGYKNGHLAGGYGSTETEEGKEYFDKTFGPLQ